MAQIKADKVDISGGAHALVWRNVKQGDTCVPVQYVGGRDRTIQAVGVFGGATVTIEGSLDPDINTAAFNQLTDLFANNISYTANGIDAITELVTQVRPVVSGGSGTTDVTVWLLFGGSR